MDEEEWIELEHIMQESPVGSNHGYRIGGSGEAGPQAYTAHSNPHMRKSLNYDFYATAGDVHTIPQVDEMKYYGMTSHRGVLQRGEYVDRDIVEGMVEEFLGRTLTEVRSLFEQGRPASRAASKESVEDCLLELQEGGCNMSILAAVIGWRVDKKGRCNLMTRALRRARERRERD